MLKQANSKYLALALCVITVSLRAEEIKVAADPWCPFTCSASSAKRGLLIEILREVLAPSTAIQYEAISWSRAINETRSGKYAAVVGALKTDAPDFVFPQTPAAHQKSCFFTTQESGWIFKDISSLKDKVLGAVSDYSYGEPVDSYIKNTGKESSKIDLITGTETAERLLKKLRDHRVDVIVEDESVISYTLSAQDDLKSFAPKKVFCQKAQPLYVAFTPANQKTSKAYASKFDEGLRKLKTSKKFRQILSSYGLSP